MSERRLLKLARLVLSVSFVVVCQLGQRWIQFLLKVCQSIPSLWSHLVSVCLLHRLQRSSSATQREVCLRATVEKKNKKDTYVHESLILNANTVTCKHVFSVAFQSSLLLFSRRTACVRLRKSTSACIACLKPAAQESRIMRRLWQSKTKVLQRGNNRLSNTKCQWLIKT